MPRLEENIHNSEELNEIITAVPSWILRRGITLILIILLTIVALSAFIKNPDVIKTQLKINSLNSPKVVIANQSGKLVKLLIRDNELVLEKQPLAFIESTANHYDVISTSKQLKFLAKRLSLGQGIQLRDFDMTGLSLGELQGDYQAFYEEYLLFSNTQSGGFYLKQKNYLEKDLRDIRKLQDNIMQQRKIQEKEHANVEEEYEAYKKLRNKNVVSNSEFKQQENKYLTSKYPLQQTATDLLNNNSSYLAKQKELAELENTVKEQKAKFMQSLNSMINKTELWLMKYVISATMAGRIGFVGILQENQNLAINQEVFIIDSENTNFFGEVQVPQYNMGKVNVGQQTLIKLRSYPFEEYGMIKGKVSHIAAYALKDSVFSAKIDLIVFEQKASKYKIVLKPGMIADAEIITEESSLLQRFVKSIFKVVNNGG